VGGVNGPVRMNVDVCRNPARQLGF
jgi:hypothetical protein